GAARAHGAAAHGGAGGAAGGRAPAHPARRRRGAAVERAARRPPGGPRAGGQHHGGAARGPGAGGDLGAAGRAAARGQAGARHRARPRSHGDGDPVPGRRARRAARSAAQRAAHARRARRGGGQPLRAGAGGPRVPAGPSGGGGGGGGGRGGRGSGGTDGRDRRRAHRADRLSHRGAGRGRRSLDRAGPRGEEPDAGNAVTAPARGGDIGGAGRKREVTLIAGDGIGPEITRATLDVLDALGLRFEWDEQYGGMSAVEKAGTPLPDATLDSIRRTGLALKGPLATPLGGGYRSVTVALRQEFDLYANVRPVKSIVPGGRYSDVDLVIIRENTEGMYVGFDRTFKVGGDPKALAHPTSVMTRDGCRSILLYAFEYARRHGRKKVTVVHKANILKATSGLFLETARAIAREYEGQI